MTTLKPHLAYAAKVVKHKWFVLRAGLHTRAPLWRLIIHDWSKLLPSEWSAYVEKFHTDRETREALGAIAEFGCAELAPFGYFVQDRFRVAWLRHQRRHPHHWEYWVEREGVALPMPMWAVREMVADWLGAGRAYAGAWPDVMRWEWLDRNRHRMELHPETSRRLDEVLGQL